MSQPGFLKPHQRGTTEGLTYFYLDAGHAHGVFAPPQDAADRLAWQGWLRGISTAFVGATVFALSLALAGPRPLEATAQIEQLAAKVEQSRKVAPQTAEEMTQLLRQPWTDCDRVACSARLQARNAAARARLMTILAERLESVPFRSAAALDPGRSRSLPASGAP